MTPTPYTARLVLESYDAHQRRGLVRLFADEDVSRYMGDGLNPRSGAGRCSTGCSPMYDRDLFDVWTARMDGRMVGHAEIKNITDIDGHEIIFVGGSALSWPGRW